MDLDIKQHFFGSFGFESRAGELQKSSALHPLLLPDSMQCVLFFQASTEHLCLHAAKVLSSCRLGPLRAKGRVHPETSADNCACSAMLLCRCFSCHLCALQCIGFSS